jgi:hypothetical protein
MAQQGLRRPTEDFRVLSLHRSGGSCETPGHLLPRRYGNGLSQPYGSPVIADFRWRMRLPWRAGDCKRKGRRHRQCVCVNLLFGSHCSCRTMKNAWNTADHTRTSATIPLMLYLPLLFYGFGAFIGSLNPCPDAVAGPSLPSGRVGLGADGLSLRARTRRSILALGSHTFLAFVLAAIMGLTVFVISASYSRLSNSSQRRGGYLVATKAAQSRWAHSG